MGMKLPADVERRILSQAAETGKAGQDDRERNSVSFMLPLSPSTNNLFATVGKHRIKTREYKAWGDVAALEIAKNKFHVASPVSIEIVLFGKVFQARDLDNFAKPCLDALVQAGIIDGDSLLHVHDVHLNYQPSEEEAFLRVTVRRM